MFLKAIQDIIIRNSAFVLNIIDFQEKWAKIIKQDSTQMTYRQLPYPPNTYSLLEVSPQLEIQ